MKNKFILSLVWMLLICGSAQAQLSITSTMTPQQYVENVLIGPGVQVSNIAFTGTNAQIGKFTGGNPGLGLNSGVVMSTGYVSTINAGGSDEFLSDIVGTPGDAGLLAVAQSLNPFITETNDAAVLTFNFVPAGDTVKFNFVFASDEYTTFSCTQWNDIFGFFVTGANPAGGNYNNTNLAVVPGTNTPITISTIYPNNAGSCNGAMNAQYYIENTPSGSHGFNGYLIPIEIKFPVVCGETYFFKFGIADVSDESYDTGIFLESGSFSSEAVNIAVTTVSGDSTVIEGCSSASLIFTRPESQTDELLEVEFTLTGTATEGDDYPSIPSPVVFQPGEDTVILTLTPIQDMLNEGEEYVTITAYTVNTCGDTIVTTGTIYIIDEPNISILENDPTALCADDSVLMTAVASGGGAPYTYSWSNGQTGSSAYGAVSVNGPTNYYVTATDICGFSKTDTVTITLNQTLSIDSMFQYPATACLPTGTVTGFASGFSGIPVYNWSGPGANSQNNVDASVFQQLSPGWYYFTVEDNVCIVQDSILLTQNQAPVASFTASQVSGCSPLTVTFTNTSQNASAFQWNFGNGSTANESNMNAQTIVYTSSAIVQLIASEAGCSDTMTLAISIAMCGCTDPSALNYDPGAQLNNGSCIYAVPMVEVPNVFTPDGDDVNELFLLNTTNAVNVEMTIFNRWGNTMFHGSGLNPSWDGKSGGNAVEEGTYFVKYIVSGYNNQKIEGHGFIQLIKR